MEYTASGGDITLSGKFTFTDHDKFRGIVDIIKEQDRAISLDFANVEFIDSAALGMLLIARDTAEKKGHKVTLKGASGQIQKMFMVSKFDTLFIMV